MEKSKNSGGTSEISVEKSENSGGKSENPAEKYFQGFSGACPCCKNYNFRTSNHLHFTLLHT